jgi:hypothetical protein
MTGAQITTDGDRVVECGMILIERLRANVEWHQSRAEERGILPGLGFDGPLFLKLLHDAVAGLAAGTTKPSRVSELIDHAVMWARDDRDSESLHSREYLTATLCQFVEMKNSNMGAILFAFRLVRTLYEDASEGEVSWHAARWTAGKLVAKAPDVGCRDLSGCHELWTTIRARSFTATVHELEEEHQAKLAQVRAERLAKMAEARV